MPSGRTLISIHEDVCNPLDEAITNKCFGVRAMIIVLDLYQVFS